MVQAFGEDESQGAISLSIAFIVNRADFEKRRRCLEEIMVAISYIISEEGKMEYYSLEGLESHFRDEDLLLEGTITIKVDVSIERPHQYVKDATGKPQLRLGEGWLVSLSLPSTGATSLSEDVLFHGEPQMICDLRYMGEETLSLRLEDALRALGIDVTAPIWQVKPAP